MDDDRHPRRTRRASLALGVRRLPEERNDRQLGDTDSGRRNCDISRQRGGGVVIDVVDGFRSFDWFSISATGDFNADGPSDFAFSEGRASPGDVYHVYVIYNPFDGVSFIRGDANFDGAVDIADAIFTLTYLFPRRSESLV